MLRPDCVHLTWRCLRNTIGLKQIAVLKFSLRHKRAVQNLQNEGFTDKEIQIETIGDVMFDALLQFKSKAHWVEEMGDRSFFEKEFGLVTVHRFENVSNREKLSQLVDELNEVHATQLPLYMPLHPSTRNRLKEFGLHLNIHQSSPVGYLQMLWLLQECSVVLTDSGGLQKRHISAKNLVSPYGSRQNGLS